MYITIGLSYFLMSFKSSWNNSISKHVSIDADPEFNICYNSFFSSFWNKMYIKWSAHIFSAPFLEFWCIFLCNSNLFKYIEYYIALVFFCVSSQSIAASLPPQRQWLLRFFCFRLVSLFYNLYKSNPLLFFKYSLFW